MKKILALILTAAILAAAMCCAAAAGDAPPFMTPIYFYQRFNTLMEAIVKAKPSVLKGQYLRSITLTSTMGPGVKVSTAKY